MAVHGWLKHALASVSEGMCPNHLTPLRASGWCPHCGHHGAWYSADFPAQTVNTTYAVPELGIYPEPD